MYREDSKYIQSLICFKLDKVSILFVYILPLVFSIHSPNINTHFPESSHSAMGHAEHGMKGKAPMTPQPMVYRTQNISIVDVSIKIISYLLSYTIVEHHLIPSNLSLGCHIFSTFSGNHG